MAHRTQIRPCKPSATWQRPNVWITRAQSSKETSMAPPADYPPAGDELPSSNDPPIGEENQQQAPRGRNKRRRLESGSNQIEPRRSKRTKKVNRSDDFYYN
ncbi:AAEL008361-PB [Aedes aegypti]|uniref:AAEL008361-PA n=1 Tax=Aedes aegypti TaxID=7159 RepID=Q16Z00_AEDAE|nr:AAEL008361-PA [Aedes aegypti]EAT39869.1 AAEL008361-PB [Aedes aegypti]